MSSLAAIMSIGDAGAASGEVSVVDVVGHLYVGGSGSWTFTRLAPDGSAGPSVRFNSSGFAHLWSEAAAALVVLMRDRVAGAVPDVGSSLGVDDVRALADVGGQQPVAAVLTVVGGALPDEVNDLSAVPAWSVTVAAEAFRRSFSRWGTSDSRTNGVA